MQRLRALRANSSNKRLSLFQSKTCNISTSNTKNRLNSFLNTKMTQSHASYPSLDRNLRTNIRLLATLTNEAEARANARVEHIKTEVKIPKKKLDESDAEPKRVRLRDVSCKSCFLYFEKDVFFIDERMMLIFHQFSCHRFQFQKY